MKILITTDWYKPVINGVVTSVINLKNELKRNGHEVKILTLSQGHHSYTTEDTIYISSLKAGIIYPNARIKIPLCRKYICELINWKPDIIHSQCEFSTFLFAKKIARSLGIPIVHTYHTVYEDYTHYFSPNGKWGRKAVVHFSKWISGYCERVIAPTEKVREMLEGYKLKCPVCVMPTGIDLNKFYMANTLDSEKTKNELNIKEDDFTAVYVGRLAAEKNIDELIKMHCKIKNPNIRLIIVGDGPQRSRLEELSKKLGAPGKVIFTGMITPNKIAQYYKCGDIFVSASASETQGLTYIEALASGLPLICKKDKCLDNVIDDIMNGLQYTSPEEYITVIEDLALKRDALKRMSRNALDSSRKFSCENFAEQAESLYAEAILSYNNRPYNLSLV